MKNNIKENYKFVLIDPDYIAFEEDVFDAQYITSSCKNYVNEMVKQHGIQTFDNGGYNDKQNLLMLSKYDCERFFDYINQHYEEE